MLSVNIAQGTRENNRIHQVLSKEELREGRIEGKNVRERGVLIGGVCESGIPSGEH